MYIRGYLAILLVLQGCTLLLDRDDTISPFNDELFPLGVSFTWHFDLADSDFKPDLIARPSRFTTSIVDTATIDMNTYYALVNYFMPGPSLPDTIFIRLSGTEVYVRFNTIDEFDEQILYSFELGATWRTRMYLNGDPFDYHGSLLSSPTGAPMVRWERSPGRSHNYWHEVFELGLGRTRIIYSTRVLGAISWQLVSTS